MLREPAARGAMDVTFGPLCNILFGVTVALHSDEGYDTHRV
jgi:hypothetical protein